MKSITVLKLKLIDTDGLQEIAELCRTGRNAGVENWLLRQRGKRESVKQRGKSESTKIYHSITAVVPTLGSNVASALAQEVNTYLSAKVDWRRGGEGPRQKRRDAILLHEDRVPWFTALYIPILNRCSTITFSDELTIRTTNLMRDQPAVAREVSLRKVPTGIKRHLHDIVAGRRKFSDSKIVERNGAWFWHLPVAFEVDVRSDVEAVLSPTIPDPDTVSRQTDRPFSLEIPGRRPWYVGDGRYLEAQTSRLLGLRKQIGWRYRQRNGAGHGRQKIDAAVRRRVKQLVNIRDEVRRRAIADVVRQCVRNECGVLVSREPTGPAKTKCWFAANGLDWDWTRFGADLKNAAARKGIEVVTRKLKIAEVLGETNATV